MKRTVIASLFIICNLNIFAQNKASKHFLVKNNARSQNVATQVSLLYSFSTFTSGYNAISGTTLTGGQKWDDLDYVLPIGFTFTLYTQTGTSINLSWGGQLLTFNDATNGPYVSFAAAMFEDICDRAYYPNVDMEGDPGGISPISYTTVGTPGNRICKVQIANAGFYGENDLYSTSTSYVNFQIWLYETSNRIEFRYGGVNIQNPSDNIYNSATGFVTGLADSVDVNTGDSPTSNMLDGPYANPNVIPWNNAVNMYVAGAVESGRVYRFDWISAPTQLVKNSQDASIEIYPNPSSQKIVISGISLNESKINILDLNGKEVEFSMKNNVVDVSEFNNGVYFMHIRLSDVVITRKLVVTH
ncbi:MAG: T9SS type A sorting domain-containing protein [Bacteroidota bacterium]|nr:T9SS type A sorting domain-containing protein [Bacteroidota bacterium]